MTSKLTPGLVKEALDELPDRIKIGAFSIKLRVVDPTSKDHHIVHGSWCPREHTIYLAHNQPSLVFLADTLLHEILHAIWNISGLDDVHDKQERIVQLMASGLVMVYRDNPWLAPWIEWCFRFDRDVNLPRTKKPGKKTKKV